MVLTEATVRWQQIPEIGNVFRSRPPAGAADHQ